MRPSPAAVAAIAVVLLSGFASTGAFVPPFAAPSPPRPTGARGRGVGGPAAAAAAAAAAGGGRPSIARASSEMAAATGRSSSAAGGEQPASSAAAPSPAAKEGAAPVPAASPPAPTSFREAEVLGLRYMQEGNYERALNAFQRGMGLPGSRADIVRTKTISGPSPVGGSQGGTEGKVEMRLDEFELQAAHYNIACAYAKLGNVPEAVANLKMAFDSGFDNYATVRADPDLSAVHGTAEFDNLMNSYDKKKGFPNPFSFLG